MPPPISTRLEQEISLPPSNDGGGLEEIQYHAPCTPISIATSETRRPMPQNNAIETSGCPSDCFSSLLDSGLDSVSNLAIGAEMRVAFGIATSNATLVKNPGPQKGLRSNQKGSMEPAGSIEYISG
jgi:hypothetical protein